jgi:hypothetical protein
MKRVLKRVDVLSCGKLMGIMYTALGLIAGILVALFASCAGALNTVPDQQMSGMMGMIFGVGAIVLMPILYGVLGFFGGMIMALLYNVTARLTGGVEFEVGE